MLVVNNTTINLNWNLASYVKLETLKTICRVSDPKFK